MYPFDGGGIIHVVGLRDAPHLPAALIPSHMTRLKVVIPSAEVSGLQSQPPLLGSATQLGASLFRLLAGLEGVVHQVEGGLARGAQSVVSLLQLSGKLAELLFGQLVLSGIHAMHEDAGDGAVATAHGQVDEIEPSLFERPTQCASQPHGRVPALEGLAGLEDSLQDLGIGLVRQLRQRFQQWLANQVAPADELVIALVG